MSLARLKDTRSIVFLSSSNEQTKNKKKKIPLTLGSKIKYPGVNLKNAKQGHLGGSVG